MSDTPLVSTGQTRVQSVSICPTSRLHCNGSCKSCIARMTPGAMQKNHVWAPLRRVVDTLDYGKQGGAVTAIITSKSEPTLDLVEGGGVKTPDFLKIIQVARERMPQVDIHTNAVLFGKKPELLELLVDNGLNMITISLASFIPAVNRDFMGNWCEPQRVIEQALKQGIYVRCSVLLTRETVRNMHNLADYILSAKSYGAHAVVVRELWRPNGAEDVPESAREVYEWVNANYVDLRIITSAFAAAAEGHGENYGLDIRYLRDLPWGAPIYSASDVNVTFAHCDEKPVNGTYKSIQLVPRESISGVTDWRIQGSWGAKGDVLG